MITEHGYSKDPSILPEGLALTMPQQFFDSRAMTPEEFKPFFEDFMRPDDAIWHFRLTNLPAARYWDQLAWVYLIMEKHIRYRLNLVSFERGKAKRFIDAPDGKLRSFPRANWVIMTGPVIKAPYDWPQRGFQGPRYTTKLF
jgi:hypothetical protein